MYKDLYIISNFSFCPLLIILLFFFLSFFLFNFFFLHFSFNLLYFFSFTFETLLFVLSFIIFFGKMKAKLAFGLHVQGEVYHSYMEVLLGDGIFNADGELWRKQRKTASLEFASKNLRDFSTVVFRDYSLKLFTILNQASLLKQQVDMQVNY